MRRWLVNNMGFTVAEVLVAAAVTAVALLGITGLFSTAANNVHHNGGMARATALAQQRIEQLRNLPFATLAAMNTPNVPPALGPSEEQNVLEGNNSFTRRTWIRVSGAAPRREASVTIILQWAELTGTKTVRLDTVIAE